MKGEIGDRRDRDEIFAYKRFGRVTESRDAAWRTLVTCQWMNDMQVGRAKQHHVTQLLRCSSIQMQADFQRRGRGHRICW